jgi:steroid delta-isomerase-like uncharacterized protein
MADHANKALVRRLYNELWNRWDFGDVADILAADVAYHGALEAGGTAGHDGFRAYAGQVRAAFADFSCTVEELIAENDRVAAMLTWRGTHRGPVLGVEPTGRRADYAGVAVCLIRGGLISHVWELADRLALKAQMEWS